MRIVILHDFRSSGVVDPFYATDTHADEHTYGYMGGKVMRAEVEDADIIIGIWPPNREAIIVKCPEGITVDTVAFPHLQKPQLLPSTSAEDFGREIQER